MTPTRRTKEQNYRRTTAKGRLAELLRKARRRAAREGREFNITREDLRMPTQCPVLGIPIRFDRASPYANRASLDRTNNALGYVKGNVNIISFRANTLKASATISEVQRILDYMRLEELAS